SRGTRSTRASRRAGRSRRSASASTTRAAGEVPQAVLGALRRQVSGLRRATAPVSRHRVSRARRHLLGAPSVAHLAARSRVRALVAVAAGARAPPLALVGAGGEARGVDRLDLRRPLP